MTRKPDVLPGTLDLLILRTLQKDVLHGWAISERIQQISEDVLQIHQGSLYPALQRIEHQGWIETTWQAREILHAHSRWTPATRHRDARWARMANAIGRVMRLA
jgi:PadR family transcriptional regulator, regulatory protein PadR